MPKRKLMLQSGVLKPLQPSINMGARRSLWRAK
jgi:hypothetical protein